MDLPFSTEQFFAVFAAYNAAIWPAQLIAYALGLAAVGALWADGRLGHGRVERGKSPATFLRPPAPPPPVSA